ncbi:ribosomal protein S6 kinase, 90kDa, polypeptide 4, partial [Reticulomyxa filosa]
KPFQSKRNKEIRREPGDDPDKKTSDLDRNVVEMDPECGHHFSGEARNLIKGLLCKRPKRRLGANGIKEIKEHPWFDPIDFGLLEAGYLDPPHVPSVVFIFNKQTKKKKQKKCVSGYNDHKYERVKIKPEFLESLHNFPFISNKVIQEEIVELLQKIRLQRRQSQDPTDTDTDPFEMCVDVRCRSILIFLFLFFLSMAHLTKKKKNNNKHYTYIRI